MASLKRHFILGGIQILLGQVGQQLTTLLRNMILARLLPPENFGIALTFIVVITALEAVSELGVELLMVKEGKSGDPQLQSTLQGVVVIRGVIASCLIFAFAGPISHFFHAPEARQSFQALALVPLLKSFVHLDLKRFESSFRYGPGVVASSISTLLGTLAGVGAAYVWRDHTAMLVAYIVQMATFLIASHVCAERRFCLSFSREHLRRLRDFGFPLLLNGILIYLVLQGDRFLVGSFLGLESLAMYGTAAILTTGVTALVMRVTGQLYLPLMADLKLADSAYHRKYEICGAISAAAALSSLFLFAVLGSSLISAGFGHRYDPPPFLMLALAVHSACRIYRSWPQYSFLALGRTGGVLLSNMISAGGVILAAIAIWLGFGLVGVACGYAIAEILAALYVTVTRYEESRDDRMIVIMLRYYGVIVTAISATSLLVVFDLLPSLWLGKLVIACLLALAFFVLLLSQSVNMKRLLREALNSRSRTSE